MEDCNISGAAGSGACITAGSGAAFRRSVLCRCVCSEMRMSSVFGMCMISCVCVCVCVYIYTLVYVKVGVYIHVLIQIRT
jgi:hypothetical protein